MINRREALFTLGASLCSALPGVVDLCSTTEGHEVQKTPKTQQKFEVATKFCHETMEIPGEFRGCFLRDIRKDDIFRGVGDKGWWRAVGDPYKRPDTPDGVLTVVCDDVISKRI